MPTPDISSLLQDAQAKLSAFGPQSNGAGIELIETELQPVPGLVASVEVEATLLQIQALLGKLFAQRGQLAGTYPAFASQWSALQDIFMAIGSAVLAQMMALPTPAPSTYDAIKSLLETLVQAINTHCTVRQLSTLQVQVAALQQQLAAQAAGSASIDQLRQSLAAQQQRLVNLAGSAAEEDPVPLFVTAFQEYVGDPKNQGFEVLYHESMAAKTADGFQQIEKAVVQSSWNSLGRVIDFINLVEAGDATAQIPPAADQAVQLRQALVKGWSGFLAFTGWDGVLDLIAPPRTGLGVLFGGLGSLYSGGEVALNFLPNGQRLNVSDRYGRAFSCTITFATGNSTPPPVPAPPSTDLVFGGIHAVESVNAKEDAGWVHTIVYELVRWQQVTPPPDAGFTNYVVTLCGTCDGAQFFDETVKFTVGCPNEVLFMVISYPNSDTSQIPTEKYVLLKANVTDYNAYLSNTKTVLADLLPVVQASQHPQTLRAVHPLVKLGRLGAPAPGIPTLLQGALDTLTAFGPQSSGAVLIPLISQLQTAPDTIASIDDEPTLQQIQALLAKLLSQRGQLAGSCPAFATQWGALEDALTAIGTAILTQMMALPTPSPATCDDIKSLLDSLLQSIDEHCTVEQLSDLETQLAALQQQLGSLQADAAKIQALQASLNALNQRLDELTERIENPVPLFLTALQEYLSDPADNGYQLLYHESVAAQFPDSFQQVQKAIAAQCNAQTVGRLVEFVNMVEAGDSFANIAPAPDQAAQLRQALMTSSHH